MSQASPQKIKLLDTILIYYACRGNYTLMKDDNDPIAY